MKIKILTLIILSLIFSCQNDDIDNGLNSINVEQNNVNSKLYNDFLENGQNGQFFSDFIKPNLKHSKRNLDLDTDKLNCSILSGSNNLNSCGPLTKMNPFNSTTAWNVLDNGTGYIDYELEKFFNIHCDYSYFCYNPGGPIIQTMVGEVEFYESPTLEFDPELGDVYVYYFLNSEEISITNSNKLAQFFACKFNEYRNTHLPDAWITNINFYGDALLCGSTGLRYLKASFTLNLHSS